MSDQKHLTLDGRIIIEKGLDNRLSFKAIALSVNKDCTTVSKEVRSHLVYEKTGAYGRPFNDCLYRKKCPRTRVCTVCIKEQKRPARCGFCGRCTSHCPDYEKEVCSRPQKPPYVCNGCADRTRCTLEKTLYRVAYADKEYRIILPEARSGPDVTEVDSVEGVRGGAVLLTIHFVKPRLQLSFKREHNDSKSVTDLSMVCIRPWALTFIKSCSPSSLETMPKKILCRSFPSLPEVSSIMRDPSA